MEKVSVKLTSPYDVICLLSSVSVAPPPGTRRLSCQKETFLKGWDSSDYYVHTEKKFKTGF